MNTLFVTTTQLADALGIRASSIRTHYYRRGHYYGLKPERLPNGRLRWPADSMRRLLREGRRS